MRIKVRQDIINKALNNVSRIATSRNSLPILSNVLIRVENQKISLVTTNLDMAIVESIITSDYEEGVITVPARLLSEFISNLPRTEEVEISTSGEKVTITASGYSSTINGTSADDFPELPEIVEEEAIKFAMSVDDFKSGVSQVIMASSNDTTRPVLTGIYFNTFEGSLYLAATDGYRLAERKFIDKVESELSVIVPTSSLQEVMRSLGDDAEEINIIVNENQIGFKINNTQITSKLIDGSYPNYRQLLPKDSEEKILVDHSELSRITKLAALFAREVGGSITLETSPYEGVFKVSSVANELGENKSEIKTEVQKDCRVTLNSRFMLDVINVLGGKSVEIGLSNSLDPILIRNPEDNNYKHIIMPLRG